MYYTPTYIVDYIVKNTVGKLVDGDPSPSPSPDGERVRRGELTPGQVANIKIVDPACGSGSFLLGAYQFLLDWHLDWYVKNDPEKWAKGKEPALTQALDPHRPSPFGDDAATSPKSDWGGLPPKKRTQKMS